MRFTRLHHLACAALAIAASGAMAQTPADAAKDGLKFDCANFTRLDDGNWKAGAHAIATYQRSTFDFSGKVFRRGESVIDGIDMKSRLDAQCLADAQPGQRR